MSKIMRLSFPQKLEINKLLEQQLVKGDDGYYEYKDGDTDATIAQRMRCNVSHIAGLRKEMGWPLRASRTSTLEERVRRIEKYLEEVHPTWRQHLLSLEPK